MYVGPAGGAHADDSCRADAFGDKVGLEADLDAAAADRGFPGNFAYFHDGSARRHLRRTSRSRFGMLQGVFGSVHEDLTASAEVIVERRIFAAEQGHRDRGPAKLAIFYRIHPAGQPPAPHESLVRLGLPLTCAPQRNFVEPDVGDMLSEEDPIRARFPGQPQLDLLIVQDFFGSSAPRPLGDQVGDAQSLVSAPDPGGMIDRQFLFGALGVEAGDDDTEVRL